MGNNSIVNAMTEIQQITATLRNSLDQYDRILTLLQVIDREIGPASPTELQKMEESLTVLLRQVSEIDQNVQSQLAIDSQQTEEVRSLLDKRTAIIKAIILLNENITTKAMGVKSLLAHEIGTLRSGLSALKGYRQQDYNQGRIVNGTS